MRCARLTAASGWTAELIRMTDAQTSQQGSGQAGKKRVLRPEVQALRAISVTTIIIFHYWHGLIPGGYIAVDIFFVISGFLITGQLVREADRTSTISMSQFWARRARRILPASLLVLFVCAVGTYLLVPLNLWSQFFGEIKASALYVENWNLAAQAVDYLAADNRPSPVQHYWTLSVEEQFYLVWPVLILIGAALARNRSAIVRRNLIAALLILLTATSLVYSIVETANNPAAAYFITPTRMWEFGAGGLLALIAEEMGRQRLRAVVSWLGVIAIVASSFIYTAKTPYPGSAALVPVFGSLAVIWAGAPDVRWAPLFWMRLRWVQWVGDNSYSIYLWHWPLLIFAPFLLLTELTTPIKFALIALMLVLSWLTKRFVEDPLRMGPFFAKHRPRRSFAFAALSTGIVLLTTVAALAVLSTRESNDTLTTAKLFASHQRCLGAAARDPQHQPCINPKLRLLVQPSPAALQGNYLKAIELTACPSLGLRLTSSRRVCNFGVPPGQAKRHVVVIGDSHAGRWRNAIGAVAAQRGWSVSLTSLLGCPDNIKMPAEGADGGAECKAWRSALPRWLASQPDVDTVFISQLAPKSDPATFKSYVAGYQATWRMFPKTVKHLIILRDNPKSPLGTLDCIERAIGDRRPAGEACAASRAKVLTAYPDMTAAAARGLNKPNVGVVDLTEFFCGAKLCYPVIGGLLVASDTSHVTPTFNRTLAPYLARALDRGKWLER